MPVLHPLFTVGRKWKLTWKPLSLSLNTYCAYQCFYNVNLLIKRNFVCVTIKRDPRMAGVLQVQKLPTKEGWLRAILIEGHRFMHRSTDAEGNK